MAGNARDIDTKCAKPYLNLNVVYPTRAEEEVMNLSTSQQPVQYQDTVTDVASVPSSPSFTRRDIYGKNGELPAGKHF
jgi:hypothetical protein